MSNIYRSWLSLHLEEHAAEGRDVQLFDVNGQKLFPMYALSGSLSTDIAAYPILRGSGPRAPAFSGSFPRTDGETIDIGNGWIAMCVIFPYHQTAQEWIAKLQVAEDKLRAMKSGG